MVLEGVHRWVQARKSFQRLDRAMDISTPTTVTVDGAGHAVITRVPDTNPARHRAEVQLTVSLPAHPGAADLRLAALATHLRNLIGAARH